MLKPTEEWWAEGLVNEKGEELFKMDGAKIYKGRWMIDNTFSYPEKKKKFPHCSKLYYSTYIFYQSSAILNLIFAQYEIMLFWKEVAVL